MNIIKDFTISIIHYTAISKAYVFLYSISLDYLMTLQYLTMKHAKDFTHCSFTLILHYIVPLHFYHRRYHFQSKRHVTFSGLYIFFWYQCCVSMYVRVLERRKRHPRRNTIGNVRSFILPMTQSILCKPEKVYGL